MNGCTYKYRLPLVQRTDKCRHKDATALWKYFVRGA